MLLTCVFTVFSPMLSSAAISLLALPWASSAQHVCLTLGERLGALGRAYLAHQPGRGFRREAAPGPPPRP